MQIFCLFFCVLCELGGKITARNAKVTQSTQVCLSKTSRPLNKSTFYIRLTALRRSGYSFPPTLCFATHWAELTHPFGAVTVVSRQFRIPPWKGGKGGCSYRHYDGWTQRFAPTWTALSSTLSFRALSLSFRASAMNLSSSSRDSSRCSEWQGYML